MRLAVTLVCCAVAAAGCGGGGERKHATPEQARAACEAYQEPVSSERNTDIEDRAKPLLHSEYDDLGVELVRFAASMRRLSGNAQAGDVSLKDLEAARKSAERLDELCAAVGVTPPPGDEE